MLKKLLIALSLLVMPSVALAAEVGDVLVVGAYCTTVVDTARLTKAITEDGNAGYARVMRDPTSKCYDARMHGPVQPVQVTLAEKLYEATHKDGRVFTFWRATAGGRDGYTWTEDDDKPEQTGWAI